MIGNYSALWRFSPPAATRAGEIAYVCHYAHSFWVIPFLGGAYARTPYNPRAFFARFYRWAAELALLGHAAAQASLYEL